MNKKFIFLKKGIDSKVNFSVILIIEKTKGEIAYEEKGCGGYGCSGRIRVGFGGNGVYLRTEIDITVKDRVTIYINGEKINPVDVNGNAVSAFVCDVFSCNGNLRSAGKEC